MKPSLFTVFLFAVILAVVWPLAAAAQDAPPAPSHALQLSGEESGPRTPLGDPGEQAARALEAEPAAVALGQPGTSFRYVERYGESETAYFEDTQHLNMPEGLATDGQNVWIVEAMGLRMMKYRNDGTFLAQLGKGGFRHGLTVSLSNPCDMVVDVEGNLWLSDSDISAVYKLKPSGEVLKTLGKPWNSGTGNDQFHRPRGLALDAAGNLYVSDNGNHRIQVFTASGVYLATIGVSGQAGSDNSHFNQPDHISIDGHRLYVADGGNGRVQAFDIANPSAPVWVWNMSTWGQGGAQSFGWPSSIAVDATRIYVADAGDNYVHVFNRDNGAWLQSLNAGWGQGQNQLWNPFDVAVDAAGNVFVADRLNHRVQQFNSALQFVRTYGTTSVPYLTDARHYNSPSGVTVAKDGSIYIVEERGHRLIKLDASGAPQWTVGRAGIGWPDDDTDLLLWPNGVATDAAGRVYVADDDQIQIYSAGGEYQGAIGVGYGQGNDEFNGARGVALDSNGRIYVADAWNHRVQVYDNQRKYIATIGQTGVAGNDNAHFNTAIDVAVGATGNIYVVDRNNHRVQVFNKDRQYLRTIGVTGQEGSDFGHFSYPITVAVDKAERVYVADGWGGRVQVFDAAGGYLTTIGGSGGARTGQLRQAEGLAVDEAGNLYIADYLNHRVQKYALGVPGWKQVNLNGWGSPNGSIDSLASFGGALYAGAGKFIRRMDATGAWTTVISDGFGYSSNVGMDDMIEFKGQLYASTWTWVCDDANCNTGHTTGGQIWRTANGTQWSRVVDAGFGDPLNAEVFGLAVFNDQLYAATWRASNTQGAELWRSSTGNPGDWTRVVSNGFGDRFNSVVLAFAVHDGALYAGTMNGATGGEVWRSSNGVDWNQVNQNGFDGQVNGEVGALASFGGNLYAGTFNRTAGGQVWRCAKCDGSDWTRLVADGFGDVENRRIAALTVFNNALYAVTNNYYGNGSEVRRTTDGQTWTLAAPAGFGDSNNRGPYWANGVTVAENRLYIGSMNYANGAEVWASSLTADFTATPSRGKPPLTVQFTNTSAGDYTTSLWDFGDGQTSTEKSPTHTYAAAGKYTVKLTVGDGTDTSMVSRQAVWVGYPLYLPLVDRNYDPLMYDNFDDTAWDGAWNPAKWVSSGENPDLFQVRQDGGALKFTGNASAQTTAINLHTQPARRTWAQVKLVEAKLQISSDRIGESSSIRLKIGSENINGHPWETACVLDAGSPSTTGFYCYVEGESGGEYDVSGPRGSYDAWNTVRIEANPNTAELRFYLNGSLLGSHVPADAAALLAATNFTPYIRVKNGEPYATSTRYVDDVRITPAK